MKRLVGSLRNAFASRKKMRISEVRKPLALIRLVVVAVFLVPVVSLGTIDQQAGPYRVSLSSQPGVVPVGQARLQFVIKDAGGKPLDGLDVRALAQMAAMPMGEREQRALPVSGAPGTYSMQTAFAMAGSYNVNLKITGPQGTAKAVIPVQTGQDTGSSSGAPISLMAVLPWAFAITVVLIVFILVRRSGQPIAWKAAFNRTTVTGIIVLAVILAISIYATGRLRRPGSMTPMQAQGMQMETPPPPGTHAVLLATVQRGSIVDTIRYSGQAVGFVEQAVSPRVTGVITFMPFYVGNRVKKGDVLARLDTSQLDPQLAERAAMTNMATQGADVAVTEYQAALQEVVQAHAELAGKRGMLAEARSMVDAARQDRLSMDAEVASMETEVTSALAEVSSAEQDAKFRSDELARSQALFDKGALSKSELQEASSSNAEGQAKLRQAQAMVRQAQAKVDAARANVRKSQAMVTAAAEKVRQAQAEVQASLAMIAAKEKEAEGAKKNIGKEQASVAVARAGYDGAAAQKSYASISAEVDGVVTERVISPGVLVNPGQIILRVAQVSPLRLQANVAAIDLERVRLGAPVTVYRGSNDTKPIHASVTSVAPSIDSRSRTGMVEAVIPNDDRSVLPGQFVTLLIDVSQAMDTLYVPVEAVQQQADMTGTDKSFVWVAEPEGNGSYQVKQVFVKTGSNDGKNFQVTGDLKEGQQVVTLGSTLLRDGAEVSAPDAPLVEDGPKVEVSAAGFKPNTITVQSGTPTTITFTRVSERGCGQEVVFPDLGIRKALPLNVPVAITFTPTKQGELTFTCGLEMLRGKVVVR